MNEISEAPDSYDTEETAPGRWSCSVIIGDDYMHFCSCSSEADALDTCRRHYTGVANEARRDLGIRIGMGGGHEGPEWYTEDNLFAHVLRLEERARAEGFRAGMLAVLGEEE